MLSVNHDFLGLFLPSRLDGLLAISGIIETENLNRSVDQIKTRNNHILSTLDDAVMDLQKSRVEEGARLCALLGPIVIQILNLTLAGRQHSESLSKSWASRLKEKVSQILEQGGACLSEEHLTQEVAILLVKGDVTEEIGRLNTHTEAIQQLLNGGGVIGRRMEFLAQEMNREANTLCSKSSDMTLTNIGIEIKIMVDGFWEQTQNIE